jgi:hypothetical protein
MRTTAISPALLVLCLFPASAWGLDVGDARFSLVEGDVQVQAEYAEDWTGATANMPLIDGDRIWVPDGGRAEIQLRNGSTVRLDEKTSLDVLNLDRDSFQGSANSGSAYVNFRGGRDDLVQIDTVDASVRAYESSTYRVDAQEGGVTEVSVFKGRVYVDNRGGVTTVTEGNAFTVSGYEYADLHRLGRVDDFERWNRDRDRELYERRYSTRYLPDELHSYSYDFDRYGRWVSAPGYGYVWTPTFGISVGWSPYRHGRWVWIRGDYVWVGYEPWGWAPYHYGRWAFVSGIGWCWVPPVRGAVYWGPGFVGWVYTPDYVAWVPLAPRETYYGYGYYGPYSVNITNINITRINIRNVYRNVYANNGVTVISNDTFVTGKPSGVRVGHNPFLTDRINVGSPSGVVKREKIHNVPIFKDISGARRPPERIREIRVPELRERRPVRKERGDLPGGPIPKAKPYKRPGEREMRIPEKGVRPPAKGGRPERGEMSIPRGERPQAERPQAGTPERPMRPERGEMRIQPERGARPGPGGPPPSQPGVERGMRPPDERPQAERPAARGPEGKGKPAKEKPSEEEEQQPGEGVDNRPGPGGPGQWGGPGTPGR